MASKPWKQDDDGNNNMNSTDQGTREDHEQEIEEPNPLAIVPSSDPLVEPPHATAATAPPHDAPPAARVEPSHAQGVVSAQRVREEEVESKISAWEAEELTKIDSRFRRQEAIINGWEADQIEKASAWLKKIERKLEEKRAKAAEKMQNEVAVARQKAEEKRASMEAKRGEKMAKVLEMAKLMKIVGRAPSKRSFFKSSKHEWA